MPPDATTEVVFGNLGAPVPRSLPPVQSPPTRRMSDRRAPTPEAALSPVRETDGMTDDTARNCSSEKRAPLTSLQDQHYDEADDLQLKKANFVRKKVSKPAQECNVISSNSDPEIAAPAIAHPHPQASTVPNVSLQREMKGVSPPILRRTATISRDGPGSIELGKDSTKKTPEDGTTAVIPKISQPLPEYLSQQAENARSESRMEGVLPEIPESPSEPHRNDHNARSEPGIASEKGKDVAPPRLTSQTARRTKFQHRSCIGCGTIVSTKSSVARFFCLSCQKAAKIVLPASGAVDRPGDGHRTEGACRPSQKQVAQLAVREADVVRQPVTEMPEDGGFTQTTTATEPSPAPAAVIGDTVEASSAEFRKVTASSSLDKAAGLVPSHQACHSRGKHTYSYHRMIGMALCDRGPLQARGIAAWIVGNIPGMDGIKEKSSMLGNVSGIVSMNADGKGKQLFKYRAWKAGDSTEFGTGTWIELQADKLDKHERWDPVLKEPVSPPRALKVQSVNARHGPEASHGAQKPSSAMLAGSKTCEQSDGKGQTPSIPRPEIEDDASSDEEPLSHIRPAMHRMASGRIPIEAVKAPTPPMPPLNDGGILGSLERPQRVSQSNSRKASPVPDLMDIESNDASTNGASAAQIAPTGQSRDARPKREPLGLQITAEEARGKTAEQIIELDYKLVTHSAKSLYLEWPEYAPENHIDKRAIMAEIKKRPTRKQMFGKPACYSRLAGSITQAEIAAPFVEQRTGKHSLREGPPSQIPENGKENVKHSERLEDFFGLPTNPLAILVDGKLAYRDGTRNEDGELVRAKAIYRTGLYATRSMHHCEE
ncbi:hypothetical protein Tdes44962_MAKER01082 [Teratosphaeria destructans]|uniref:Uncharacterized protein n=1 Tax=Teratosphaeria destructans TaxID=418781 RepID=A0A9W7VY35_9PEZI|nr:hypothetical protein Tdes44962_MAKER01082 [Teratosphaeria destructans]